MRSWTLCVVTIVAVTVVDRVSSQSGNPSNIDTSMRSWTLCVVAILAVTVVDRVSSQSGNPSNIDTSVNSLDTNPSGQRDANAIQDTNTSDVGNTGVNTANIISESTATNGATGAAARANTKPKQTKRKPRRRVRKRGRKRAGKRKPPKKNSGSTKPEAVVTKAEVKLTTQPPTAKAEPLQQQFVENIAVKQVKEKPIVKTVKTVTKDKPKAAKEQRAFFNFFDDATTTTAATAAGPPPDIVFDKPSIKVMPSVDPSKAKAYDGTPCNETYKPYETSKHKYMMKYAEGVWGTLDCPPNLDKGLVWRQDLCSCGEELVPQDPNDWCGLEGFNPHPTNKHKYTRRHHGAQAQMDCAANLVWSQENCQCMYDPTVQDRPIENPVTFVCKKILHLEFEGNLKNSAEAYHVQPVNLKRRGKLPRIRFVKVPGATDQAAMIVSQPLEFLAYRGNDFQKHVTFFFNFKLSPRHHSRKNYMVLLTDDCRESQNRKSKGPGISLKFQPSTISFKLDFRTETSEISEVIKGAEADRSGWFKTVVYFEDNSLNLENNGKLLFSQKDIPGKIPQTKCPLYIAGRGQGFDRSQDFYGYMDNVLLIKDCKFHQTNIKIL